MPAPVRNAELRSLAALFLRLGTVAFGGPAAHIVMMRREVVDRLGWLSDAQFIDLVGANHLIPGPNSTELAIHIGYQRAGVPGLLVAGVCFIAPASLIVGLMAWGYVTFGQRPQLAGVLYGMKPVVLLIIGQAIVQLGRTALQGRDRVALALLSALAAGLWGREVLILLGGGVLLLLWRWLAGRRPPTLSALPLLLGTFPVGVAGAPVALGLMPLFGVFFKLGVVLFGSGYVLLAFLQSELVTQRGWLTQPQLLDAIVVGQVTPGPVFTTATFIGYMLAGPAGAFWATVGIFLPAFGFVWLTAPVVPRLRQSPAMGHFLDGVNAAAVALMGGVAAQLFPAAVVDGTTAGLLLASLLASVHLRVNTTVLCLAGGLIGGWLHR